MSYKCGNYLDIVFNAKSQHFFVAGADFSRVCDGLLIGQDTIYHGLIR